MNILMILRWSAFAFVVVMMTGLLSGCIVPNGGYGYDNEVGVGAAYYEPYGVEYGGWGPGYHVAPFRGGDHRPTGGGSHGSTHAYKSAPASRAMPSLPSHGGGRGSGGGNKRR
jgi:hypothetical protein